ncbi:uncharacterized protein At1g76070-like [Salvia miltiorrhiza]|uniref:uncharacterized protein At1g76070-like n=1 Tax=Salvia miltiorrhiza TaxID=226208 RepID=UPI0025ABD400|nr:uncharacterized protein At1g76070-like [Salvia miltiorrhiza]
MEKQSSKSKNKILRFLPKAAKASFSFQNPSLSPGRDKRANGSSQKLKSHLYRAFSGPIISMIPAEAREESTSFETQEPTSPKISCMGQIKHKKTICKLHQHASLPTEFGPVLHSQPERISKTLLPGPAAELKKKPAGIKKNFGGRRKSDDSINRGKPPLPDRAPCLSQMMRFASSRDTFASYDWATADGAGEDWGSYSDGDEDAVVPMLGGGGIVLEPRREINLWKRRTMPQLKPLQLTTLC